MYLKNVHYKEIDYHYHGFNDWKSIVTNPLVIETPLQLFIEDTRTEYLAQKVRKDLLIVRIRDERNLNLLDKFTNLSEADI